MHKLEVENVEINPFKAHCPSRDILEVIGGKWAVLLICRLQAGPLRSGVLTRSVEGISQKMLTQTLRELERNGIVERISYHETPPRVEYHLTFMGHDLSRLVVAMEEWVVYHYASMVEAQDEYDKRSSTKWIPTKKKITD